MKKNLLFMLAFLCSSAIAFGQTSFSDDFESYNVGDYVGVVSPDWTTWSGNVGGAEDMQVVNDNAASGSQSCYIAGTGTGGPQDVVLPFGGQYTEGQFDFSMKIFIPEGSTGAYFNFQAEETIGVTWATQGYFRENGALEFDAGTNGGGVIVLATTYEKDTWTEIAYSINLSSNSWAVSVNGDCIGAFEAPDNAVASLDIFPLGAGQNFWVDDVSYSHDPNAGSPTLDLGLTEISLRPNGITGQEKPVSGAVKNNGTEMITSFDLNISDGSIDVSQSFTGLMLAGGDTYNFDLTEIYTILEGANIVSFSISNVNGTMDDENACNNAINLTLTGYTPAPDKEVFVEEATGTWCPWCPRGAVWMDIMTAEYGEYFAGVAVHNNDPMVVADHDSGMGSFPGFTGYPSCIVARSTVVDPAAMEAPFFADLVVPSSAVLENGAEYDAATGELKLSLTANFTASMPASSSVLMVLLEDGVTGTGSGYNQANNYAGGGNGPMGGYEDLPASVPASQMVYEHTSRAILGGFNGEELGTGMTAGDQHIVNYTLTVDPEWDLTKMKVIGVILNANGTANNAMEITLEDAIFNGFNMVVSTEDFVNSNAINAFPNPFGDELNLTINLEETAEVSAKIVSMDGKVMRMQEYGAMNGENTVSMPTDDLAEGFYHVNIIVGNQVIVKKVVLAR